MTGNFIIICHDFSFYSSHIEVAEIVIMETLALEYPGISIVRGILFGK